MGLAQPGPAIFAQRWRGRWAAGHACAPRISSMCFFSTSRQAYVGKDHLLQQFHFSWFSYGHFFLKKKWEAEIRRSRICLKAWTLGCVFFDVENLDGPDDNGDMMDALEFGR